MSAPLSRTQEFTARDGRRFAFPVTLALLLIAAIAARKGNPILGIVLSVGATILLLGGTVIPASLGPIHRAWMSFAGQVSKVTTPIILGILWFVVITPFALLARGLRRRSITATGWTPRDAVAAQSDLRRQF